MRKVPQESPGNKPDPNRWRFPGNKRIKPDWEGFGKTIMKCWPDGGIDRRELEQVAIQHGILLVEPYDVKKHGTYGRDRLGMNEKEPWYVRNYYY